MNEYPDNSYSSRENNTEHKFEKVVNGTVTIRKKGAMARIAEQLRPSDRKAVENAILTDVVVPSLKNVMADIVSLVLFGEAGLIRGGKAGSVSRIAYQKIFDKDADRPMARPKAYGGFEFDDILFETRGDAELLLEQLGAAIDMYGIASVADLYDLADLPNPKGYPANKYGWTNISTSRVVQTRRGYVLQMPRVVQIS